MFIDFHCHLQADCFKNDLQKVIFRAKKQGVDRFLCNACDIPDWKIIDKIAKQFKNVIIPCYGIHPLYVDERYPAILPKLLPYILLRSDKEQGIKTPVGEIGLDHYDKKRNDSLQESIFRIQLQIAKTENRVIMLHTRKALDRVIEILHEEGPFPVILFHGFSGPMERAQKMIDLGGFFSFSANLLKPNHRKTHEAAENIPLERILLESDAPDMPPPREMWPEDWPENEPVRNEPAIITQTLHKLAEIRKIPEKALLEQIQANEQCFMQRISF